MDEELTRKVAAVRRVLWSLRIPLVVVPALCGALGLGVAALVTPRFESEITVSLKDQDVFNNLLKDMVAPMNSKTSTASAKALLETSPVVDRVAIQAGLADSTTDHQRRQAVRKRLLASFKIRQSSSESGLFTISATASSAKSAHDIANALAREFLRETASMRLRTANLALGYLKDQMDKTWQQLEQERAKMAEFRSKNIFSLPDFALDGTINLLQLRKDQIDTRSKLSETRKRIELIQEYYRQSDPQLSALRAELAEVLARRERLRGDYTDEHPAMRELLFQERQLRRLILNHRPDTSRVLPRDRITMQLGSDGKTSYSASPADAFLLGRQFQEQDLLLEEEMLQVKLSQMDSLLAGLQGGLEKIPDLQRMLAQQQAEIDRLQKSYDEIRSRWSDAQHSIEVASLDVDSDFSVASPATLPESPVYPVPFGFMVAGAVLGLLVVVGSGMGLAWMRGRVRDATDLEEVLAIRCLGTMPDMNGRDGRSP